MHDHNLKLLIRDIKANPNLSEHKKKRAIKGLERESTNRKRDLLSRTLSECFIWAGTPEGHSFWADVRDALRGGKAVKEVHVYVGGGLVQHIDVPEGILVHVYDCDVEGVEERDLSKAPNGEDCVHSEWRNES